MDELTLVVHLPEAVEKKVVIRRASTFAELQYVLKCEFGDSVGSSPLNAQFKGRRRKGPSLKKNYFNFSFPKMSLSL